MVKDVEIIRRIDRKQVVPKERYKLKTMTAQISASGRGWDGEFPAQETQEGFKKEEAKPVGP